MDFFKSSGHIAFDQIVSVSHRDLCWQILPTVGTEMIAAEDQLRLGKMHRVGQPADKAAKIGWRHAGVAAKLVNLV